MGKSTSSKRARRSNASSSARRRKSNGSKIKKTKSKKSSSRRLRHDSDSWSSESDYHRSSSHSSDSYSISEDDYRRSRRSRSFSRKDGRKSKKRVRRDSNHSLSSDERSPPSKRRKESKRKGGGSLTRRKGGRSRYGRDASGDYSSCSTCANRSNKEDEYESHRGRAEKRDSHTEMRDNQSKDRSGSCSSCCQCSRSSCGRDSMFSGDSRSEERATNENNSKRLRSVIVVNAEGRKWEENKEEIVYDKDDYPSSRSNDSNDDESKKDVLDTKEMFESWKGKEVVVSKLHVEPSGPSGNWVDGKQCNSRPSLGTNHKDLETMLRLRALQNLQKLRGTKKAATGLASQEPSVAAAEEPELPREDQANATGATSRDSSGVAEKSRIINEKAVYARPGKVPTGKQSGCVSEGLVRRTVVGVPRQEVLSAVAPAFSNPWRTAYTWRRETALSKPPAKPLISPQKPKLPLQQKHLRTETLIPTIAAENPQRESALNQLPTENLSSPMVTEAIDSVSFAESGQNESASGVSRAKELSLPEIPKAFEAKTAVTEMATTAITIMSGQNGNATDQTSLNKVPQQISLIPDQSTNAKGASGEESSEKVVDVVKEGTQYEQKTMSVTHGGETIQVNYQVYIPKRTPALARRQLKRDS